MVALDPDPKVARSLAIPGGESPKEIHLTLGFFGADDDLSTAQQSALKNLTHQLATKLAGFPLEGSRTATRRFSTHRWTCRDSTPSTTGC
jgi:hypothetical protein